MLDSTAVIETHTDTSETECPACGIAFVTGRKNQEYCSRCCQKNAARSFRHLENFARDEHEAARARDLRDMLYAAPPSERLGTMKDILDAAYYDGGLRNILTRPELLSDKPFSAGRGQMNIAKAADAYCKKFLRMSVRSYIRHVKAQLKAKHLCELLDVHIEVGKDRNSHGPVPSLRSKLTSSNVKRIHQHSPQGGCDKPLPDGDDGKTRAAFEMADRVIEEVEARMATVSHDVPKQPLEVTTGDEVMTPTEGELSAPSSKQEAKRKIALSKVCFDKGVSIDSHTGRTHASSMGIRTL